MALVLADRVKVSTTTTGTGTYTLGSAATGYQDFAVIGNANTTYYTVTDGTNWEVGIGTYTSSGTTLSRDTILSSSNAGSAVNWGAGTKEVFVTYPSSKSVTEGGSPTFNTLTLTATGNINTLDLAGRISVGVFPNSTTNNGEAWVGRAADRSAGTLTVQLGSGSGRKFEVVDSGWTTVEFSADDSGISTSAGSSRAPIFYDSNNTGYYIDPNGTSSLLDLRVGADSGVNRKIEMRAGSGGGDYSAIRCLFAGAEQRTVHFFSDAWQGGNTRLSGASINLTGGGGVTMGPWNAPWAICNSDYLEHSSDMRAPIFYDSNDTGYYLDPNSTSNSALRIRGGTLHGPNTTWGAYLYVGTNGNIDVNTATVAATNGNLHLDAANGYVMYLNNYATSSYTIVSQSCRSPIFYDLNDTGYYCDPNSTSNLVAWTTNGRNNSNEWIQFNNYSGLYSPLNGAHFYPNNVTYGSWRVLGSRNGWIGLHFETYMTLMMNDNACGVHREGSGWRYYVEGTNLYCNGQIQAYWSDRRLKENFRPIRSESLDILSKMTAYRFNWNKKVEELGLDIEVGKEEISLIAQDVEAILPDAVAVNKAGASPSAKEGEFDYLTIKYDRITPIVVQAINELRERIERLETV